MMDAEHKNYLHKRLIVLGDILGDGDCAYEKEVRREYRSILRALGYLPKRVRADIPLINRKMQQRCQETHCDTIACPGQLEQTRSGSMVAVCTHCNQRYQLLRRKR